MTSLVLGPLLRHVDDTSATIWVETAAAATVTVSAGEHRASAPTFGAHGHHYALVEVTGLAPGSRTAYVVDVDGERVWPAASPEAGEFPPSVIATLEPGKPLRMAFGSCRVSLPHDEAGTAKHGIDALRSYALFMAGITSDASPEDTQRWPDLVLFLGDQVYADETSEAMQEFIEARRGTEQPPGEEIKDYEEYAHLYALAWSEAANRWLLSTLPSAMIFDDHDIRDDWNTSYSWKQEMEQTSWWHERIVGGLAAYWVYQHLGNLSAAERAEDALWQRIATYDGPGELDITTELDELADRADQEPTSYRWSFSRDFDTQARLVVIDSRAARELAPDHRSILDADELAWFDEKMQGGFDHVLVGTSLPLLLAPGLHHAEAWNEAVSQGAWGRLAARVGEKLRQAADMEHWAAFQEGFRSVVDLTLAVAAGERGSAPKTITYLSGDVHHSYVAEAWPDERVESREISTRILQAVCSPIRNPLPPFMQRLTARAARRSAGRFARRLSKAAKVPLTGLDWDMLAGPWYDNNLAILELQPEGMKMWWTAGEVRDGNLNRPVLRRVATVDGLA
ncbi:alkaline phosphatase D family protein [Nocardioides sp. LS1]|uniref:alkaline phosphatase D family protein n=1 Tax=Nocardioides sp. LS1 TaxID=1027620 RepID=UPI000F61E100|nr:alkaline phosphatase D family protein [Nocardioides sp. LS1]